MPRNLFRFTPAILGLALFDACAPEDEPDDLTDDTQEMAPPATEPAPMTPPAEDAARTVDFQPGPAGAGVTGVLQIEPSGEDTQVRVNLTGLSQGEHAWHIHNAPCGADGPVVYAFTATADMEGTADPITVGEDGSAAATATVPGAILSRDLLSSGEYSIHVHERGGTDHGGTVACADF